MNERILPRRLAQEMTKSEVEAVSGGACYHTPNTVCDTWQDQWLDHTQCDGGMDCDF